MSDNTNKRTAHPAIEYICAWCNKQLKHTGSNQLQFTLETMSSYITHGICKDCATKLKSR